MEEEEEEEEILFALSPGSSKLKYPYFAKAAKNGLEGEPFC